ncbi:hypothetical protein QBC47DRAFT_82279 [Echria macrotheca]|uniref:Nephrocystin 3-like N-terminal domain-containing protein n=1 Tax=Echria macrotheca TaxID=438768 RepID=A0AAJ0B4E6_9PEZI|nr:hypothetical protein QBC47DRAFT_82279 [Echria macrotheca]
MPPNQHTTLRDLTENCLRQFAKCRANPRLSRESTAWLEDALARFRWWSFGLNVQKDGRSSLDHRVETHSDVRRAISRLLISLRDVLSEYEAAALPPLPSSSSLHDQDADQSDTSSTISSSDDVGDSDEGHGRSRLATQQFYIEHCLRHLAHISTLIRRSGEKYRHRRADDDLKRIEQANPRSHPDLRTHLEVMICFGPYEQALLAHLDSAVDRGEASKSVRIVIRAWLRTRLGPIQQRLIQANIIRRHRMLFARRHKQSVDQVVSRQHPFERPAVTVRLPLPPTEGSVFPDRMPETSTAQLRPRLVNLASEVHSVTAIGSNINLEAAVRPTRPASALSKLTRTGQAQNYPKRSMLEKSPCCPYCGIILEEDYRKSDKKWSGHVSHDLAPYTCIFDGCDSPYNLYVNRDQWMEHLRANHSVTRWFCSLCSADSAEPDAKYFWTELEYQGHIMSHHDAQFSSYEVPLLLKISEKSTIQPTSCPLCLNDRQLVTVEQDDHIASHLHAFSLLALPWDHDIDDALASPSSGDSSPPPGLDLLVGAADDDEVDDDSMDLDASRKSIISLTESMLRRWKSLIPGGDTAQTPLHHLAFLLTETWPVSQITRDQRETLTSLLSRLRQTLDSYLVGVDAPDDLEMTIAPDVEAVQVCLEPVTTMPEEYRMWEHAWGALNKNTRSLIDTAMSRFLAENSWSLPSQLDTLLNNTWALKDKCKKPKADSGSDSDMQACEDIVEALQRILDDGYLFLWPETVMLPWALILLLTEQLSKLFDFTDEGHLDHRLKKANMLWTLRLTLHAINLTRLYSIAYPPESTLEEACGSLFFARQNMYEALLELLILAQSPPSLFETQEMARAIAGHPHRSSSETIKKLDHAVFQLEKAVVACEHGRLTPMDPHILRTLAATPRIRLDSQVSGYLKSESTLGGLDEPPGDTDDQFDDERDMELMEWVSSLPFNSHHRDTQRRRLHGTCEWIIGTSKFQSWLEGDQSSSLWLRGSFGTGKTFLTSKVIDHIRDRIQPAPSSSSPPSPPGFAFVYCDKLPEADRHTAMPLLRAILVQLATFEDDGETNKVVGALRHHWEAARLAGTRSMDVQECVEWVLAALKVHKRTTTIVLDGIDKLQRSAQTQLFSALRYLIEWTPAPLKVFLSCPDVEELVTAKDELATLYTITLHHWTGHERDRGPYPTYSDIWSVADSHVQARSDVYVHMGMLDGIANWSEGSFFHGVFYAQLEKGSDSNKNKGLGVHFALATTYRRAFSKFRELRKDDKTVCKLVFMLVAYSGIPFTTDMLLAAIRLREPDLEIPDENQLRLLWPEALFMDLDLPNFDRPIWRMTHSSIADYAAQEPDVAWDKTLALTGILEIYLRLLINSQEPPDFSDSSGASGLSTVPRRRRAREALPDDKLRVYARHCWPQVLHAIQSQPGFDISHSNVYEMFKGFFGSPGHGSVHFRRWLSWIRIEAGDQDIRPTDSYFYPARAMFLVNHESPIVTIMDTGLQDFLFSWLREKQPEIQATLNSDVLAEVGSFAVRDVGRAVQVARELLALGVDLNQPLSRNVNVATVLGEAIREGPDEWFEFLLNNGVDVNVNRRSVAEGMRVAARNGRAWVIARLLGTGISPDEDGLGWENMSSPLAEAAVSGNMQIVKLLLDSGAKAGRMLTGRVVSAVAAAASNPEALAILKLLVERGADIHLQGGEAGSALAEACVADNEPAAEFLVTRGADVNEQLRTGKYGSPLVAAASHDSMACLRFLLGVGADIEKQVTVGTVGNALAAAALHGAINCLRELISARANVNRPIATGIYGSSLAAAAAGGHLQCVLDSIEAGAEVNYEIQTGQYGSALIAAACAGKANCVHTLLSKGADVHKSYTFGKIGSALEAAVYGGDHECITAIIRTGTDVNQQLVVGEYGSALGAAAGLRRLAALETLIEAGANINLLHESESAKYGSPLVAAAGKGADKCVRALVRAGAEVDLEVEVGRFGTALVATANVWPASTVCTQILIEAGADVNRNIKSRPATYFGTALIAAAYLGRVRCAGYLLENGADAGLQLENGRFRNAIEAAETPVDEADIKFFHLPIAPMIVHGTRGLVRDKKLVLELLQKKLTSGQSPKVKS